MPEAIDFREAGARACLRELYRMVQAGECSVPEVSPATEWLFYVEALLSTGKPAPRSAVLLIWDLRRMSLEDKVDFRVTVAAADRFREVSGRIDMLLDAATPARPATTTSLS